MAKVMLVEDDNNLREIYQARLQAEGYDIVAAKDGEEALVVAKNEKPDLVISDVMMPKISGFEMLDILRNTPGLEATKVIMLTALGQSDDQQRADKLGADRYLVKSQVTLEDIVKTAHDLLEDAAPSQTEPTPTPAAPAPPAAAPVEAAPAPQPPVTPQPIVRAAESTAQETAEVEANIESFVAGATNEATTPAATMPDPAAAPDTAVAPVSQPTPADNTTANDDLITAATNSLAGTPAAEPMAPAVPAPVQPGVTPDEPADQAASETESSGSSRKIIKPLDAEPKKDINALLAVEEAKEADNAPATPPVAVVATAEEPAQTKPLEAAPGDSVDPNSVAL